MMFQDVVDAPLDPVGSVVPARPPLTSHGNRRVSRVDPHMEGRIQNLEVEMKQISNMLFAINDRQAQMFTMLKSGHVSTGALDSPSKSNTIIHQKARIERYPNSTTKRFKVPDDKVPWEASFPEYAPVIYEAPVVEAGPYWADVSLVNKAPSERELLQYNKIDSTCNVNRMSHTGKYNVVDNFPLNPMGRTGITGRGLLGRFGPNHAADPIATRWKHESGGIMKSH